MTPPRPPHDKASLLASLVLKIKTDLEALERRQRDTQEAATHEENRAEHAKDTRATEQSYLARGLAERVENLGRTLEALERLELRHFNDEDAIAVGALVEIDIEVEAENADSRREIWFVVPGAGGIDLESNGDSIRTVTPVSPFGRSLLGLHAGDEGNAKTPRGRRTFEILSIA